MAIGFLRVLANKYRSLNRRSMSHVRLVDFSSSPIPTTSDATDSVGYKLVRDIQLSNFDMNFVVH